MATALTATMGAGMATQLVQAAEVTPYEAALEAVITMEKDPSGANIDKAYNAVKALKAGTQKDALYKRVEKVAAPHHKAVYDIMVTARANKDLKTIGDARKAVAGMAKIFINDAYTWSSELDNFTIEHQKTVVDTLTAIANGKEEVKQATINELREIIVGLELQRSNEGLLKLVLDYSATLDKVQMDYVNEVLAEVKAATTEAKLAGAKAKYNDLLTMKDEALKAAVQSNIGAAIVAKEAELSIPKVESVSAINGTTLQVKFNKAVNASTLYNTTTGAIDSSAITFDGTSSANPITAANLTGSLSADGKELTVSVTGGTEFFKGTYAVELMKDKVKLKDDASQFVNAYQGLVTVSDEVGPSITGVTFDGSTAVVDFSEALKTEGTVSLNGVQQAAGTGYATFVAGSKKLTLNNIEAGKSYTLTVVSAKDVAGNLTSPNVLTYTFTAPVDNAKPAVAVSVTGTKVTFDFSEELKLADLDSDGTADDFAKVTLGSGTPIYLSAAEQDASDKTKFVYDFNSDVTGDFLNSTIKVENFTDKAGLAGNAYTIAVTLQKDKAAPKFVSATTKDDKLIVKFDEDVTTSVAAGDLAVKYVNSEGVLTPAAAPTAIGATANSYDANGNGTIDGDEENYIVIPLTGSQFVSNGKLKAGNYTVTIASGKVADTAAVVNATTSATTFTLAIAGDTTTKAIVQLESAAQQTAPGQILATFNNFMGTSALVASNYKLGGVTLPSNATLTFLNDKKNVLITLPEGYVTANGDRVLEVANLKDIDGNTLKEGKTSVVTTGVKENVAPTATKVTLIDSQNLSVDFSEALAALPGTVTGVKVKVNGNEIALDTTGAFVLDSTSKVITIKADSATAFKLTDTITVEFSGTNIKDAAGNTVKDVVLTK